MLDSSTYGLADPRTWRPSTNVCNGHQTFDWLIEHLKMYDRLLYTSGSMGITYGFQPFTLNKGMVVQPSWLRNLTAHKPTITKYVKNFKTAKGFIHEFITWNIPDCGCLSVYINDDKPTMLAFVSSSLFDDRSVSQREVFDTYVNQIKESSGVQLTIHIMKNFSMIYP